jgi:hypothetical protein
MFIRRGSAILRAPEPENTGGGGTPAFTDEQQAAIGQIVNQAVTSQLKRGLGPAIGEALKATKWDEVLAPSVNGLLDKYLDGVPNPDDGDGDTDPAPKPGKTGKKSGNDSALEAQLQKLATELETERKARQAAETARTDAEQKRLLDGANTAFRNALQPKLRPDLLDVAVGHFGSGLKVGEDGSALLRVKKAPYKGAPEEDMDLPLGEALPILLAAENMKPFLPAPGAPSDPKRGGGPRDHHNPGPAPTGNDPASKTIAQLNSMGLSADDI